MKMPVTRQAVGQRDRQYWKQQKKWKKNPSNEGEKTELQPNDRHKKTRLVIGLFCVFQSWVGGSDRRRLLYT